MKNFRFKKIDAFATPKSSGNPAGYIQLNSKSDIDGNEMLKIAKELKGYVNEVGYLYQSNPEEFDLKFYSSEREVDFCGHATIAIMHDLLRNSALVQSGSIKINTNRGSLKVENRIKKENAVFIMSPLPVAKSTIPPIQDIARALKVDVQDLNNSLPIKIINAGVNTLIVPFFLLKAVLSATPDLDELKNFCESSGADIIVVFTDDVFDKNNDYRVRVFAPTFGYLEDPATGSGNAALGYYLRQAGLWKSDKLSIEQNNLPSDFNIVKLEVAKDADGLERVLFGGGGITRIEGEYTLY